MSYLAQGSIFDTISSVVTAASDVVQDPALPTVAGLVIQLHSQQPTSGSGKTASKAPGIGLSSIVTPLRAYVYVRRNSWALPLGIAAVLGIPFLLGFKLGRKKKG